MGSESDLRRVNETMCLPFVFQHELLRCSVILGNLGFLGILGNLGNLGILGNLAFLVSVVSLLE